MSNDFNPGEGWRRTFRQDAIHRGDYLHLNFANEGVAAVYWVRDEQAALLPTKPYTLIRVTWPEDQLDVPWLLLDTGEWMDLTLGYRYPPERFKGITSFEVLSEPRAVTAKAVADRFAKYTPLAGSTYQQVLAEFGVES